VLKSVERRKKKISPGGCATRERRGWRIWGEESDEGESGEGGFLRGGIAPGRKGGTITSKVGQKNDTGNQKIGKKVV